MKSKTRDVELDTDQARALAAAVRAYAHAAFPQGGSECAQVSRAALLETATHCERHCGGKLSLRRRQLPLLRAAVRWALSEDEPDKVQFSADLESVLH